MDNQTDIKIKFTNSITKAKALENYAKTLKTIKSALAGIDSGKITQIEESNKAIKDTDKETKEAKKNIKAAFDYTVIKAFGRELGQVWKTMNKFTSKSADYAENLNLFAVAFRNTTKSVRETTNEALKFTNTLSEMYGLDESWLLQTIGKFKQLANAMGLGDETGTRLSQLLTQMSLDISSLYNTDFNRASSVLQSSLAGQTKPIRGLAGGDITQATLQTTLDNLGIDKQVSTLSFAEKRLLIIISLTKQLNESIGDMGNTIESPANQMRIMNSQWERLVRTVGDIFMPILAKILPYINAILMVLTEIAEVIANIMATIFGYDKNEAINYAAGISTEIDEIATGLDTAADNAKKLKSGLRGFDKLNVITTPTSASSSVGSGGIGADIMNAFNNAYDAYYKKLSNVTTKATELRDKIMEWLGFEKHINKETDDVYFTFSKITGGTVLGALAVGGAIFLGIKKIVGFFKAMKGIKLVGGSLIDKLLGGGKSGGKALEEVGKTGAAAEGMKFKLPSFKTVLTAIGELALIIAACTAVVMAFSALSKIEGFDTFVKNGVTNMVAIFVGIGKIAIPLAEMAVVLALVGKLGKSIYEGMIPLGTIIVASGAVVAAFGGLALIQGFDTFISGGVEAMVKIFDGIQKIILPVVEIGAVSAILGILSPVIYSGLLALGVIIGGATAVILAFGALAKIPKIDEFVNGGIDLMCQIFEGVGKIIGVLIGGIIEGISEGLCKSLEMFGTSLSNFMDNASGFFDAVSNYGPTTFEAIEALAKALITLTAASLLDGLTSWLPGKCSLEKFGQELAAFGPHFEEFASGVAGVDEATVAKTKIVAKAMNIIIDFTKKIPNSGGVAGFFAGENDLDDFAKQLPQFGKDFAQYSVNISKTNTGVVENSEKAKESMLHLIEFAKKIPNEGGVAGFFAGENNIATFGQNIASFGKSFAEYSSSIAKVDLNKVDSVTNSLKKIVDNFIDIKNNKLDNTVKDFGKELKNSASNIKSFYDSAFSSTNASDIGWAFGKNLANAVSNGFKSQKLPTLSIDNKAGGNIAKYDIKAYAGGGLPPVGQLFVANEKGPELVSHLGGQSFVANQNQVMDMISKNSKPTSVNPTIILQVGTREVAREIISDLQDMAKTNGKPIQIGG